MALANLIRGFVLLCMCVSECMSDYYSVLAVSHSASEKEIKTAFRELARKLHPDRNHSPDAHKLFTQLAQAYEVLSDPERRKLYDQSSQEGQQDVGFDSDSERGGSYGNSVFQSFSLHDLLVMLQMEEHFIMSEEPLGQEWSFSTWAEGQEDDDYHLNVFSMF